MKRMAEVGWRKRAAIVLPLGMYGHQVAFMDKDKDKDKDNYIGYHHFIHTH